MLIAHGDSRKLIVLYRLILKGDDIAVDIPLREVRYELYSPKDYGVDKRLDKLNQMIRDAHLAKMMIRHSYEKFK